MGTHTHISTHASRENKIDDATRRHADRDNDVHRAKVRKRRPHSRRHHLSSSWLDVKVYVQMHVYVCVCTYNKTIIARRVLEVHFVLDHKSRRRDTLCEAAHSLKAQTEFWALVLVHLAGTRAVSAAANVAAHIIVQRTLAHRIWRAAVAEDAHEAAYM